jgi:hypothetical protein
MSPEKQTRYVGKSGKSYSGRGQGADRRSAREVMAFVESLKPKSADNGAKQYSFVGIARSGIGSLSTKVGLDP